MSVEARLRALERLVATARQRIAKLSDGARRVDERSIGLAAAGISGGIWWPPINCAYENWPETLTWDFQGICPAGIQDTRDIIKTNDLGTVLGATYDGIRGWIGDPDEYPGVGRSSYRFVEELTNGHYRGNYAKDDGGSFTVQQFNTVTYCRQHSLYAIEYAPYPAAWVRP